MNFYEILYGLIILSIMPLSILGYINSKRKEPRNPTRYVIFPLFLLSPLLVFKIYGNYFITSSTLQYAIDVCCMLLAILFVLILLITLWLAWRRGYIDTNRKQIIVSTVKNCAGVLALIGILAMLITVLG